MKPASPALEGGFLTTGPQGSPCLFVIRGEDSYYKIEKLPPQVIKISITNEGQMYMGCLQMQGPVKDTISPMTYSDWEYIIWI